MQPPTHSDSRDHASPNAPRGFAGADAPSWGGAAECGSLSRLYEPDASEQGSAFDLGQCLVERGAVTPEQLDTARRVLRQTPGRRLAEILLGMGVAEAVVQEAAAEAAGVSFRRLSAAEPPDPELLSRLGGEFCRRHGVIPIGLEQGRVVVGTVGAEDVFLLDEVKRRLGVSVVRQVLITSADLEAALAAAEGPGEEVDISSLLADVAEDDVEVQREEEVADDIERQAESSPVVRFVNHIIQTAVKEGASDIHLEPGDRHLRVRFRIDGVLFEAMTPPRQMHAAITSRIKIMANLDIAERRLPQDGRIRATVLGRPLDIRVSTIPTPIGEKSVLRLLDNRSIQVDLDRLGFSPHTLSGWKEQIEQPHGIILVTGPTGSGKTTTLYSSIRQMDMRRMNISTVEDPVEYHLSGITQIQTHDRIGMSFARALKALLRQDPDVVMVGEIRDLDTAVTAIQAALTGHLVLSTLHTNDAPGSVTRLINIGVEPFLVGAALNAVLAQRLVRRNCSHCARPLNRGPELRELLTRENLADCTPLAGDGCERCRRTGYSGRLGIFELLCLDDRLRDAVAGSPSVTEFRRLCVESGMVSLRRDGFRKVASGDTTVAEVLRVTEGDL